MKTKTMFDFEKLVVFQVLHRLNVEILKYLVSNPRIDDFLKDQLKRATLSASLNLAEGAGRSTRPDKRRFFTMARSSTFECVAIISYLKECDFISEVTYRRWYAEYEQVSKMLLALIRKANALKDV